MNKPTQLSRRRFLQATSLTASGLVVSVSLSGCSSQKPYPYADESELQATAFIQITHLGEVRFFLPNAEMGQGVAMGLTTLVAEELNMHPQAIDLRMAGVHKEYGMPGMGFQVTGGSSSIRERFIPLRQSIANVRQLLLNAASQSLNVPAQSLVLKDNAILHNQQSHPITEFIDIAKTLEVPEEAPLKSPKDFRWIGKQTTPRIDALSKVTGTAEFGMDVKVPNCKVAVVKGCPVFGGTIRTFSSDKVKVQPGVIAVVPVYNGVAVVANTYWQAQAAAEHLSIDWNFPEELRSNSSSNIDQMLEAGFSEEGKKAHDEGDIEDGKASSTHTVTSHYKTPYLAHATMEPMNCTVRIQGDAMEIWIPSQAPDFAQYVGHKYSDIPQENITVHSTFLGGGFGRRAGHDYLAQAVQIAVATKEPIKLIWSREDDTQHGYYRPISYAEMSGGVDDSGDIQYWAAKRVGPNNMPYALEEMASMFMPGFLEGFGDWLGKKSHGIFANWFVDPMSVEGIAEDYSIPNTEVRHVTVDPKLRLGAWRSVGHSFTGFFKESFMDELAHKAGQDPLEFRLKHLKDNPRLQNVLKIAGERAQWHNRGSNRFLGIATQKSFETYVAEIAEVSVKNNQITVHKVYCVVDCGVAVNPDIVKSQMESGIIFGLTAALHGEITLEKGVVQQSNFHDYPILRMSESPEIDVYIVNSSEPPTGVGEPGLPPIAPAVANAVFAATGTRLRSLPLRL